MKLEEIEKLWEADSKINRAELDGELLKIAQLHHKYYKIYNIEKQTLREAQRAFREMYKKKCEYYDGKLDKATLDKMGWEPHALRVLRTDLPAYIDADADMNDLRANVEKQEAKIEYIESIIKSLVNRGFNIKAAVEFIKFQMGA